jgi:anti-sigma factor RsiW
MSPLNCSEAEEHLGLYAAGECDAGTRQAVEEHLAGCPACRREQAEAQRLADLLELRGREPAGLARLRVRLAAEDRSGRVRGGRQLTVRLGALAALLLVTFGLLWDIGPTPSEAAPVQLSASLVPLLGRGGPEHRVAVQAPGEVRMEAKGLTGLLALGGKTPTAFQQEVEAARGTNGLPPPPEVNFGMQMRNTGEDPLTLNFGKDSYLWLDLRGPGVLSVPARDPKDQPALTPHTVRLEPGASYTLPIPRLIYGSPERVRYAYWTKAGIYDLSIRLDVLVREEKRSAMRTVMVPPVEVRVGPDR